MIRKKQKDVKVFLDEVIQEVIEKYIACGCDGSLLYNGMSFFIIFRKK